MTADVRFKKEKNEILWGIELVRFILRKKKKKSQTLSWPAAVIGCFMHTVSNEPICGDRVATLC